jgi:uncharacterized protein (DUF433 family)
MVKGSRIPLQAVLNNYAAGMTPEEIARLFPGLDVEKVREIVAFALAKQVISVNVSPQVENWLRMIRRQNRSYV